MYFHGCRIGNERVSLAALNALESCILQQLGERVKEAVDAPGRYSGLSEKPPRLQQSCSDARESVRSETPRKTYWEHIACEKLLCRILSRRTPYLRIADSPGSQAVLSVRRAL